MLFTMRHNRVLRALVVVLLALVVPAVALAESGPTATTITLSAPDSVRLGQTVKVSAKLVDASGKPIPNANISFSNPNTFFLGRTGDALIEQVKTDKDGVAELEYSVRSTAQLGFKAEFRGNDRYNASRATAPIEIEGATGQLYHQEAGVDIPILNAPPLGHAQPHEGDEMAESVAPSTGLASLWPTMSFWPIGLVLLIVWSLYAAAVWQMWRIVGARSESYPGRRSGLRNIPIAGGSGGGSTTRVAISDYHFTSDGGGL